MIGDSEEVILKDPNLDPAKLPANYNAKVTVKKKTVEKLINFLHHGK